MTDGEENSSREWSMEGIRQLLRSKEALGNWTFVFLGANLDAFTQGTRLGVPLANAVRYDTARYGDVFGSLALHTRVFSASSALNDSDFFKGNTTGSEKSQRRAY